MGGIKLSIHPLFFIFGLYQALTGRITVFLICTLSALCHELGHSLVAQNLGYKLNKITLMPFGAVVKGDTDGLKSFDEIKIALAGPLFSLAITLFFIASWWIFPETYAFTDVVASTNLSIALVNLIPAYPLDGGRVLFALIREKAGEKASNGVCTALGVVLSIAMFALFIVSAFYVINPSLLFFSFFCLFGSLGKKDGTKYVRLFGGLDEKRLSRGMPIKAQAVSTKTSLKKVMQLLDYNAVNEVVVFDGQNKVFSLSQEKLLKILEKGDLHAPIGKYLT